LKKREFAPAGQENWKEARRASAKLKPQSIDEVLVIQDAVDRHILNDCGYKFHKKPTAPLCYAPLYPSKLFQAAPNPVRDGAHLKDRSRIAFRTIRDLPPRATDYTNDE